MAFTPTKPAAKGIAPGKYRATTGFDVIEHDGIPAVRVEEGGDPSVACACHMQARLDAGLIELVPPPSTEGTK